MNGNTSHPEPGSHALLQIRNEILRDMYAEAEPPFDFDDALENPEGLDEKWYLNHRLPEGRATEIFQSYIEKHDLSQRDEQALRVACILDLAPATKQVE